MRVPTLVGAFVAPLALLACATGVLPSDPDLGGGTGDGGLASGDSGYGGRGDGGPSTTADSGAGDDTGTTTNPDTGTSVVDSGPPPVVDSGSSALHGGDCTRTTSTQFTPTKSYDQVCDDYYFSTSGGSAACTRGGTSCARYNGMAGFTTFCCYKPPTGSNCYFDYFGGAQCVPE